MPAYPADGGKSCSCTTGGWTGSPGRLGVPGALAEVYADRLDWHQVARLVQRGCPPQLALRIIL